MVQTFDPSTKQEKQPRITTYSYPTALAFGPDGLVPYVGPKRLLLPGTTLIQALNRKNNQE